MDLDSPEDIFGQIIEMNDEVFDEMFEVEPGNVSNSTKESTFTAFKPSDGSRLSLSKLCASISTVIVSFLSPFYCHL